MLEAERLVHEGNILTQRGDFVAAEGKLTNALNLDPAYPSALHAMAVLMLARRNEDEALRYFALSLDGAPANAVFQYNYGMALQNAGRLLEARNAFEASARLRPDHADAWAGLGMMILMLGERHDDAERALLTALRLVPDHIAALRHLRALRGLQGRDRDSAAILQRLAALLPREEAACLSEAAACLMRLKDFTPAVALLRRAVAIDPENTLLQGFLGTCLGEAGLVEQARKELQNAALDGTVPSVWRWKYLAYCPDVFPSVAAVGQYRDWLATGLDRAVAEAPLFSMQTLGESGFCPPPGLSFQGMACRHAYERFAAFFAPSFTAFTAPLPRPRGTGTAIRAGFVVAAGQEQQFFRAMSSVIRRLPDERFEQVLFYPQGMEGLFALLRGPGIIHRPYAGNVEAVAEHIRAVRCDILYHWNAAETPLAYYLPMFRPAPVQCTSWGTRATTGQKAMDYYLSWDAAEPEGAGDLYTETLVGFSSPPVTEPPDYSLPGLATRRDLGLPEKNTLYFCPHRMQKYHPAFDGYLGDILAHDGDSRILILISGARTSEERMRQRIISAVGQKNARRLIFSPRMDAVRYFQCMGAADVILESPAYSGFRTAFDAFYQGKPCVTQKGGLFSQRLTSAYYTAMGVPDAPVARGQEEYVRSALRLSRDEAYRNTLAGIIRTGVRVFQGSEATVQEFASFFERAVS